jgi:hypothetical protein
MRRHHTSSDGQSFHPEPPVLQELGAPQWCPQRRKRRPENAATITNDIVSESFRSDNHKTSRKHPTMAVEHSPSLLEIFWTANFTCVRP